MVIPNECVVGCAYGDCTSDEHSDFCPCAKEVALFEIHDPLSPGSWSNVPGAPISKDDLKYLRDKYVSVAPPTTYVCPKCKFEVEQTASISKGGRKPGMKLPIYAYGTQETDVCPVCFQEWLESSFPHMVEKGK